MTTWTSSGLVVRPAAVWTNSPGRPRRAARLSCGRDEVWRCDHHHETKEGAAGCAFRAWQALRDGLRPVIPA